MRYSTESLLHNHDADTGTTLIKKEITMNMDRIMGNLKQVKSRFKHQFGRMLNDQFIIMESRRDHQEGVAQEEYGIFLDEAPMQFSEWQASHKRK